MRPITEKELESILYEIKIGRFPNVPDGISITGLQYFIIGKAMFEWEDKRDNILIGKAIAKWKGIVKYKK